MKKLVTLSSLFIVLILLLTGCQKTSDINSPDNLNKLPPPPVYTYTCDPTSILDGTVDLIAGQHNPVGYATFHINASGNLEITYSDTVSGSLMTEVHIDFATTLNNDAAHGGFHANSTGNPQPGLFDVNVALSPGQTTWSMTIPKATLLTYLNLPAGSNLPATFYIAAHGVINYGGGAGLCPTLPNGKWRHLAQVPGSYYYMEGAQLRETSDPNSQLLYVLNGWCIDRDRGAKPGIPVQVDFLCSTDDISCYVDLPQNIGAVNWLLNNQTFNGNTSGRSIQVTIWKLLDTSSEPFKPYDTLMVNALYAEALNHLSFVPGCGQIIGVVMFEEGYDYCTNPSQAMQAFLVEQTVICGGSDTMWGFDWDFNNGTPLAGYSCVFVDPGNWARYFKFPTTL